MSESRQLSVITPSLHGVIVLSLLFEDGEVEVFDSTFGSIGSIPVLNFSGGESVVSS